MIKSFKQMSMQEAITWTEKNCSFADVRNRLASRMVAYLFYEALKQGATYVSSLEQELQRAIAIMEDMLVTLDKRNKRIEELEKLVENLQKEPV